VSDVFEFAVRKPRMKLGPERTDESVVDITSRLGRHEQVTLEVDAAEGTDPSWFTIEPADVSIQDGETTSVRVAVAVPPEVPAGEYGFALRAYAVSDPQNDFTLSQVSTIQVSDAEKGGIPSWLLALLASIAVLLLLVIVWFLFLRGGSESVDDVIAKPVAQAKAELEDNFTVTVFSDETADESGSCVLLQSPPAGAEAETVALLTTKCPNPAPLVTLPDVASDPCRQSFRFCQAVDVDFPDPPQNAEWLEVSREMGNQFVEAFTVPGVDTPDVVGLPLIDARQILQAAGLRFSEVPDGGPGTACTADGQLKGPPVLLQHPFGGLGTPENSLVTLVLTACPAEAQRTEDVQIQSLVDLATFANLEAAVPEFADAIGQDDNLGLAYIGSEEAASTFGNMVQLFRQQYAVPRVPDVVGLNLGQATTLLEDLGIEVVPVNDGRLQTALVWSICPTIRVTSQSIVVGERVATLEEPKITLGVTTIYTTCLRVPDGLTLSDNVLDRVFEGDFVLTAPTP